MAISLILSALQQGADTQGRWLDAQAIYERVGGRATGSTSFRVALRKLEPLFRVLLRRRFETLGHDAPELQGRLGHFADALMPDGCAFKIAAALAGSWPGTSNAAEFKLHAVYSVRTNGPVALSQSAGRVHDNVGFVPENWVRGALYLWDLGYQDYDRFVDAALSGAIPLVDVALWVVVGALLHTKCGRADVVDVERLVGFWISRASSGSAPGLEAKPVQPSKSGVPGRSRPRHGAPDPCGAIGDAACFL